MSKNKINLKEIFKKTPIYKWVVCIVLLSIPLFGGAETREAYFASISDGYLQVSVFVALTLFIFYGLENVLKVDTEKFLKKHKKYQVPIATLLGVLPGCGGAIMVMTQYTLGRLGFGAVVAVLTSTMGDAAFLLLSQRPSDALIIFGISIFVGIIFGYLTEWIHGYDFMRPKKIEGKKDFGTFYEYGKLKTPWLLVLIPGIILGLLTAFQAIDPLDQFFAGFGIEGFSALWGVLGAFLSVILWLINPTAGTSASHLYQCKTRGEVADKVVADTAFVSVWVFVGYLVFELGVLWTGFNFEGVFENVAVLMPLMGVLVGLLPGCGPQVIVTTMYLQGLIPFSAQIGNAISNDGDALFPAIAVSPKASIVATIYTTIPALIVSYGYYFLMEA